jgi:putative transposase
MYHVMSRGDRREMIFLDDADRQSFLSTLGEACSKTGWEVHAYVWMGNHFHLVLETAQANLCLGMKWLLGTFTQRWNRRRKAWGHLFGGRYKAQSIDERSPQ